MFFDKRHNCKIITRIIISVISSSRNSRAGFILLVIRFMADLLRKYRGSVVIMVGRGGAEPHYVHN